MLYDDYGVARVAQLFERMNKTSVVALVQSYRGLVEDVEHVDELRPNLRGQAYALALAAGETHRGARQAEVVETYVHEKLYARAYLFENLGRYLLLAGRQLWVGKPGVELLDVHIGQLGDVLVADAEMQGFAVEACSVAVGAYVGLRELFGPFLCRGAGIAVLHHLDVFHEAVIGDVVVVGGVSRGSGYAQAFGATVENLVDGLVGNVAQRCL